MKKLFYWIGAFVTVAAIFAAIAVLLKKLKISLSIEGIDDTLEDDEAPEDIDLIIEDPDFSETEEAVEDALEELLNDELNDEIEVEISEE